MTSEQHAPVIGHVNRYRQVDADAIKSHGSLVTLPEVPIVSFGISAAMLFMRSDDRRRFPYDPELDFGLHAEEQVLYAVRLLAMIFFVPQDTPLQPTTRVPEIVFPMKQSASATVRTGWPRPLGLKPNICWV